MTRMLRLAVMVCVVLGLTLPAWAGPSPAAPPPIPEALRPWIDWVAPAGYRCAVAADGKPVCAWPGRLDLEVDDKGGSFKLDVRLDEGESVALPGSSDAWPLDVKVDDGPGVVLAGPVLSVARGAHVITGRFAWSAMPASLRVPAEIGLLRSLRVRGALVAAPNRDKDGVSLVSASESEATTPTPTAADTVDVRVVRVLSTSRPLRLDTWVRLKVGGHPRELLLGPALPEGFAAIALQSKWPARLEPDGKLRVRASSGEVDVVVSALATGRPTEIKRPVPSATWTTGDEVWAFVDQDQLQVNSVEGPPRVPKTSLGAVPGAGSVEEGNCFALKDGASLKLVSKPRLAAAGKDRLQLQRFFAIAADGSGIAVSDMINGELAAPARFEFSPDLVAGEALVDSQRQVLGSVDGRPPGFEVPGSARSIFGSAWLPHVSWTLPVEAFGRTYEKRDVTFLAQAGWLPLHVGGVGLLGDVAVGDVLLVLLVGFVMFVAHGWRVALLAFATLLVGQIYPRMPAAPFLAVAIMAWIANRVPEARKGLALSAHRALVVVAALSLLSATRTSLLFAFEPESVSFDEPEEQTVDLPNYDKSGGTGTKHKGAEGMMGDPSKNLPAAPIAFDSDDKPMSPKKSDTEAKKSKEFELRARSFDPNSLPQFGPGATPRAWFRLELPVPEGQSTIRAIWSPPLTTAMLSLLRVLGSVALVVALLRFRPKSTAPAAPAPATAAAATLLAALVLSPVAHAQALPDAALLEQLKEKLTLAPACRPNCTQIARLAIEARKREVVLRMEVHAGEAAAFALPTGFEVGEVLVDRKPADLVRTDAALLVRLEPGIHEVTVDGALDDSTSIAFGTLTPHHVTSLLDGWTLEGVRDDGSADPVLTLSTGTPSAKPVAKAVDLGKGALAVMVDVQRELDFDIEWKVRTTVTRVSGGLPPEEKPAPLPPASVEIALLPGESIVAQPTPALEPHEGKVTVTLDGNKSVSWTSSLAFQAQLKLVAPSATDRFETWTYTSSSRWRVTHSGIASLPGSPVRFAPWPGESTTLGLVRPTGLPGATARLESSEITSNDRTLEMKLHASQLAALGWSIELPEGYEIEPSYMRSGWVLEGRTLRVKEGYVSLKLQRKTSSLGGLVASVPAVKASAKGVGASTTIRADGWLLFASSSRSSQGGRLSGNLVGLALAVVFAFVARVLGRDGKQTAIAAAAGLMFTTPKLLAALVPFAVLLTMLEVRRRWAEGLVPPPPVTKGKLTRPLYTFGQLVLGALGIAAILGFVAVAVMQALYGDPNPQHTVTWFLDRHDGALPSAFVVSLPIVVYRLVMAAWLAAWALLLRDLLPWAYRAYAKGGALQATPAPAAPPPAAEIEASASGASAKKE